MKNLSTADIRTLVPNYCDTITTKEIAKSLGISTSKAYNLCIEAEKEGWLFKFGYKTKFGYEDVSNSTLHTNSLTWQNVEQ